MKSWFVVLLLLMFHVLVVCVCACVRVCWWRGGARTDSVEQAEHFTELNYHTCCCAASLLPSLPRGSSRISGTCIFGGLCLSYEFLRDS